MAPFKIPGNAIEDSAVGADQVDSSLGFIPAGGIIMWSGTIASIANIDGWALCDGQNGPPDLRNKFIVCASDDAGTGVTFDAGTGAESGDYAPNTFGGSTAHQLNIDQMPSHDHPYTNGDAYWTVDSSATQNEGPASGGSELTTRSAVNAQGGGQYHENRPPYYALAYIMKLA